VTGFPQQLTQNDPGRKLAHCASLVQDPHAVVPADGIQQPTPPLTVSPQMQDELPLHCRLPLAQRL
jgi:hypothetical protein